VGIRFKTFEFDEGDRTLFVRYIPDGENRGWIFNGSIKNSPDMPVDARPAFENYDKLPVVLKHDRYGMHQYKERSADGTYQVYYNYIADKLPNGIVTTNSNRHETGYHIHVPESHPLYNYDIFMNMEDDYYIPTITKLADIVSKKIDIIILKPLIDVILKGQRKMYKKMKHDHD
jgi:hypothetical protein